MAKRYALPGKVYLTGAGPGAAKLLTVCALEVLQRADLVLHDDLVSEDVLSMVPAHVSIHNVGKRCGLRKTAQEEIHRRMIEAARNGQTVVRLKGGDPLVFARTREEIEALRDAGIDFEIIPGITAATGAAALAQIPLTDRAHASKLVFVSNHRCAEKGGRDWYKSVTDDATLVFYMPGTDLEQLSGELVESGLCTETACLLVSQATRSGQKVVRTTIAGLTTASRVAAPSLLIVGTAAAKARVDEEWLPGSAERETGSGVFEEISLELAPPDEMTAS